MEQPSEVRHVDGKLQTQFWYKKGFCHRDGALPAYIGYKDEQMNYQAWCKNGEIIRKKLY
jgi:hypothetical protein